MADATLLYDSDCGFCRWALGVLLWLDRRERIRPVALQDAAAEELIAGRVPPERKMESMHLVSGDGRLASGGDAMRETFRLLPGLAPLAALLDRAPRFAERVYYWVAHHRGILGRTVGRLGRDRADRLIAERRG